MYRVIPISQASHRNSKQQQPAHWADVVQTACDALSYASLGERACITVSGRLAQGPEEASRLRERCKRLADEYGFGVEVRISDSTFDVRLVRSAGN